MTLAWDYIIMDCQNLDDGWHAWQIDGIELPNWRRSSVIKEARRLGAEGWELVNIGHSGNLKFEYWVFKRPLR